MRLSNRSRCGALLLTIVSLAGSACLRTAAPTEPLGDHAHSVLFVGNSLTYTNDLPAVFKDVARAGGFDVGVEMMAYPDVALIDYVYNASAMRFLEQSKWDFVVLQQGTTSVPICRDTLVLAAQRMDPLIRKNGGVPALMMTWPSASRQHVWNEVYTSYALAAQAIDGIFLPVGDAWLEAWKIDAQLQLYGSDGYHPGAAATLLAAYVLYEKLSGRDARELTTDIGSVTRQMQLPAAMVRLLQEAAHSANTKTVPKIVVPPTPVGTPIRC
ncbi:MAG: hypothetical protein ACO1Q7_15130 [Gemmatimonas sp.]